MTTTNQIIPEGFKTSIAVLSRVMNLRESVIANLLKQHNIDISDWSRKNIEADQLELLSAFFNKKVKNYFTSSIDELESLSDNELHELRSFCATYSKTGGFTKSWRSIDKDKIKEDFLRKVLDETHSEEFLSSITVRRVAHRYINTSKPCIYIGDINIEALREMIYSIIDESLEEVYDPYVKLSLLSDEVVYKKPPIVLFFTQNYRFQARTRKGKVINKEKRTKTRRIVYVSARYHIFSDDGVTDDNSFNPAA